MLGAQPHLKTILTTPTPHICKKHAPKMCHTGGKYGIDIPKTQGISTEKLASGPQNMAYEIPPPLLCHMKNFHQPFSTDYVIKAWGRRQ